MGFVRKAPLLRFDDPELEGLEVRASSVPIDKFVYITQLGERIAAGEGFTKDNGDAIVEFIDLFVESVVSWNLERDEGHPVTLDRTARPANDSKEPVTKRWEALDYLISDPMFGLVLANAWLDAIGGVSPPLNSKSSDGKPSPEGLTLPMEPLSPNQESLVLPGL